VVNRRQNSDASDSGAPENGGGKSVRSSAIIIVGGSTSSTTTSDAEDSVSQSLSKSNAIGGIKGSGRTGG